MAEKAHGPLAFGRLFEGREAPLIVGGQAVNLWALEFLGEFPELKRFEPFTSHDCDLYGDTELLERLSRLTGWPSKPSRQRSPSPVVGYLRGAAPDGSVLIVEILFTLRGLTSEEIRQNAVALEVDGKIYRTLSPIALLKAKVANLAELSQAHRQDLRHARILITCVAGYIARAHAKIESGEMSDKAFLKLLTACQEVACSRQARKVAEAHRISFRGCFPDLLHASPSERARKFAVHQIRRVP